MMTQPSPLISEPEEYFPGMSDEEELRRVGKFYADGQGVGEIMAELEDDVRELGFKVE